MYVTECYVTARVTVVSVVRKMASLPKRSRPRRIRHGLETECETESEKEALGRRLDRVRQLLTPPGARTIDNGTLLNTMCDIVEREAGRSSPATRDVSDEHPVTQSFMRSSGKLLNVYTNVYTCSKLCTSSFVCVGVYTGHTAPTDSHLFICEYHTLTDLLEGLKAPCVCGMSAHPWTVDSSVQVYTYIWITCCGLPVLCI